MKNFVIKETDWSSISPLKDAYLSALQGKNDGFHADMLFDAAPHLVEADGHPVGFFALQNGWDGGKMLTGLYLEKAYTAAAASLLDHIIADYTVTAALVASNDAPFVAIAFEKMQKLGTTFVTQAYNYTYGLPKRPPEFAREQLEKVLPTEYEAMNRLTEGQWDGCFGLPGFRFFALRDKGETRGYGAIVPLKGDETRVDLGNFTLPQYRQKGVGRSLIIHLAQMALEEGFTPVVGCWAGNKESIPTLKSSGFLPENRLFYVKFI